MYKAIPLSHQDYLLGLISAANILLREVVTKADYRPWSFPCSENTSIAELHKLVSEKKNSSFSLSIQTLELFGDQSASKWNSNAFLWHWIQQRKAFETTK